MSIVRIVIIVKTTLYALINVTLICVTLILQMRSKFANIDGAKTSLKQPMTKNIFEKKIQNEAKLRPI